MKSTTWLALAVALGCTAATSAADDTVNSPLTFPMKATPRNAGRIGQVTLVAQKGQTELMFVVSGVPAGTVVPADIDTYIYPGTCASHGDEPAYVIRSPYARGDRLLTRPNTMTRVVPVLLGDLTSADHAIVLRTGPEDGLVEIFCGDIGSAA
jgi:hypothetical protein